MVEEGGANRLRTWVALLPGCWSSVVQIAAGESFPNQVAARQGEEQGEHCLAGFEAGAGDRPAAAGSGLAGSAVAEAVAWVAASVAAAVAVPGWSGQSPAATSWLGGLVGRLDQAGEKLEIGGTFDIINLDVTIFQLLHKLFLRAMWESEVNIEGDNCN